jgi:hypothetical protein
MNLSIQPSFPSWLFGIFITNAVPLLVAGIPASPWQAVLQWTQNQLIHPPGVQAEYKPSKGGEGGEGPR